MEFNREVIENGFGIRDARDRFRMKPDDDFTDWDVYHYGRIIEDHEVTIAGRYPVRLKVYAYRERYFMELWCAGIRVYYGECVGYGD